MPIRREVADRAAVHHRRVPDRDVVADGCRCVAVHVDHRGVLDVATVANPNVVAVAAQHRAEPDARVAPEEHAADDGGARRDEELVAKRLHPEIAEIVKHRRSSAAYFFAFAWSATAFAAAAIAS